MHHSIYLFLVNHNRINNRIPQLLRPLSSQKIFISVFIPTLQFELLPDFPEGVLIHGRVAVLGQVDVDCTCAVELVKFALKLREPEGKEDEVGA